MTGFSEVNSQNVTPSLIWRSRPLVVAAIGGVRREVPVIRDITPQAIELPMIVDPGGGMSRLKDMVLVDRKTHEVRIRLRS